MKIKIIGSNSYIGNHLYDKLLSLGHEVAVFDAKERTVEECSFDGIDSVVIVAAIVHKKHCKDSKLFERINADLPFEYAQKAKKFGVKQVVFISTMAVYGAKKTLCGTFIDNKSPLNPTSLYGKSKLLGERKLLSLKDDIFKISIVRPANVYGIGAKGHYFDGFVKLARLFPTNPIIEYNAIQGIIFIDNLVEAIIKIIVFMMDGIFALQDIDSPTSSKLIEMINACLQNKKKKSAFPWNIISINKSLYGKIFGGISYSEEMLTFSKSCQIVTTADAVKRIVK